MKASLLSCGRVTDIIHCNLPPPSCENPRDNHNYPVLLLKAVCKKWGTLCSAKTNIQGIHILVQNGCVACRSVACCLRMKSSLYQSFIVPPPPRTHAALCCVLRCTGCCAVLGAALCCVLRCAVLCAALCCHPDPSTTARCSLRGGAAWCGSI